MELMNVFTVIEASSLLRMLHAPLPSWNIFVTLTSWQNIVGLCRKVQLFCGETFFPQNLKIKIYSIRMACEFQNK